MTLRKIIKINSVILVFLIIPLLGNITVITANEGHEETEIDISNGYTSEVQILKWNEQIIFEFEITEVADFTFEIYNINASLFYYSFNHENEEASVLNLLGGDHGEEAVVEEGETLNHDNLPVGAHIELDVVRHLKITEVENYTLTIDNSHDHEADTVQFQFRFSLGLNGEEEFGTFEEGKEDDAPGFGFAFSIVALFAIVFSSQKFQRSKRS